MRLHANLVRLAWAVLLLVLVQAWAAVTHVHAVPEARPLASSAAVAATADPSHAAAATGSERAPADDETECDCLWCSPRLHLFLCIAFAAQLLGVIRRLLSRIRPVDVTAPPWRTRFLSPPALRAPPALPCAAG
ncbi:hypothetical protein [Cupriavidus nantongensis]|uniref:hypothetical protein n=1 Tax=Cupriavidus nantongensis TaxID=1796606 RepID=UPI002246B141|nr:hypothetical protein [Cupriavidus nantongensis]